MCFRPLPPLPLSVTTPVLAILLPTVFTIFDIEDRGQKPEFSRNFLKAFRATMLPVSKIPIYEPDVDASFDLTFDPRF